VAKKEKQHLTLRANLQIFGVEIPNRTRIFARAERQQSREYPERFLDGQAKKTPGRNEEI